ncbi:LysR family transcriptional regulator [Sebaldella sp. S0638]|uniref:LysR family transcriptional regulator n=1 Tax=Sebaldella sp. S0638 TaxID=2957809 RepID=UPI00209FC691|nr:LysR family transcriptional regulator [Sebaldella sp. S0638]MCP1225377.1 LysR family transcriptional regulator [Sebaldella sp. S0638]
MLDFRHETFLALCRIGNYTKTAEFLHITQPAVTQHIKFLENYYDVKLFNYEKKNLSLTREGKLLYDYAMTMSADNKKIRDILAEKDTESISVSFGTTLTVGEYVMPGILRKLLCKYPGSSVTMSVENTKVLLEKLKNGEINFVILEGFFEKTKYDSVTFSEEEFVAVCSPDSGLKNKQVTLKEILGERIILREKGSGTRDIFEQILYRHNLGIQNFTKKCEIGNINVIKELVKKNLGITFLYKAAVEKELAEKKLSRINITGFSEQYEFNFVFLKDSIYKKEYLKWYKLLKSFR